MKKLAKVLRILALILIFLAIIGYGIFSYLFYGNLIPYYSCGGDFSNGFKKAVESNNLEFCYEFNEENINQYKNFKGNYYCQSPKIGFMEYKYTISKDAFEERCLLAMMEATNDIKYCLQPETSIETCPFKLATKTGNKEYCDFIPRNSAVYELCLEYFEEPIGYK